MIYFFSVKTHHLGKLRFKLFLVSQNNLFKYVHQIDGDFQIKKIILEVLQNFLAEIFLVVLQFFLIFIVITLLWSNILDQFITIFLKL